MKKVLIISPSMEEQNMIDEMMAGQSTLNFEVESTGSFGQPSEWWLSSPPDALILRLPAEEFLLNFFFTKLKADVPRTVPMIFICDFVPSALMQLTSQYQKVRILKVPVQNVELFRSILDLLIEAGPDKQQIAPRYMTNQAVTITAKNKEGVLTATIKNISVSGAFIVTNNNSINLDNGDFVVIQIQIPKVKSYSFNAKVVWFKLMDDGSIGFGCNFIETLPA